MTDSAPPPEPLAVRDPLALPDPPRAISPAVGRRAWFDPAVRARWLVAAALLVATGYMAFVGWRAWAHQAWLSRSGTVVQAKIVQASGLVFGSRAAPPDSEVTLAFVWDGRPRQATGRLGDRKSGEFITVGSTVPVRVNPTDPEDWTSFAQPPPAGG
ncbi:MAG: hypothetical protein JWO31_2142, partial [Phycisphaerales bacterium]|nr:hypothetical protein [Phycisphaerales bacterium]